MNQRALLHEATGEGEPIVLVPGGLSGWLSWIPHAEQLSAERKVVRVQLRSVELAEAGVPYPADYSVRSEIDGLKATVDDLGLESFDLAGWSHGGLVALAFALEYPQRVRSLTVVEPAAPWILREAGWNPDMLATLEEKDRSTEGRNISVDDLRDFLVRAGFGNPGDDFEKMPSWPVWVRNRQVLSVIATVWDYTDSLERLRSLDIPVLGVKGTETSEDMIAIVDHLVANTRRGKVLELPGGHACHIENSNRFRDELIAHTTMARVQVP
jgi:pimeloyl-ACP methyl ester carboxylesterase